MSEVKNGIEFYNVKTGEKRLAETVEHIAAFYNSSNLGPNAHNKQDFGWRVGAEDLVELERIKANGRIMEGIAAVYQVPAEDVADYNVLKYIADNRRKANAQANQVEGDFTDDYEKEVAAARKGGKSEPKAPATPKPADKPRTVNRSAKDGEFVSEEEAKANPDTTVKETVDKPEKTTNS